MRVLAFITLGAITAMGIPVSQAGAAPEAGCTPLRVQVDLGASLGPADLEGFRGVCVWNLPSDPADPMHKAWMRAGLTYPRWPWVGGVDVSWQQNDDGSREMVLDFDGLDALLAGCNQMPIEPIFLVGGTPTALSSNPDVEIDEFDTPGHYAPADYGDWEEYTSRIVRRLLDAGYPGRYYEIANEPEDFKFHWKGRPGSDKKDTLADYVELYVHTARAIKATDPSAKVGGPVSGHWDTVTASGGFHGWGLPEFLRALAAYRKDHPDECVPLDFVDWHDYSFLSPVVSDGVDFVDKILTEVEWPDRPEYFITEWNFSLSDSEPTPLQRSAHAAWNIIREAHPETRRLARTYWYVLDGGGGIAVVDLPAPDAPDASSSGRPYILTPVYAVFEVLGIMNEGDYARATAEEPLVAMATMDEDAVRLMVCNNTGEARTATIVLNDLPARFRSGRCRVQLVDEEHSADGDGLEEGKEIDWQPDREMSLELAPCATALVTIQIEQEVMHQ